MAKKDRTEFLHKAIDRFEKLGTLDSDNRDAARRDLRFVYNIDEGQWPEGVKAERKAENRPCLTSNKLRKFVSQVANREREQRLAGDVLPVDSAGDRDVAQIIAGLVRQIEHASEADVIYTKAGEHAVAAGFGYWRISIEKPADSFDEEIFIREIDDQFSVRLDPQGRFGFVGTRMSKDEFEEEYPNAIPEDFDAGIHGYPDGWYSTDDLYICEYFYKEKETVEIVKARFQGTGEVNIFTINDKNGITEDALVSTGWVIEDRKQPRKYIVKWAKITASQVLEEATWTGDEIPIIEVEGDWIKYEGRLHKRSLIRDAKDDQRMFNYWLTNVTETVALSVKAPYLVTKRMISGLKSYWDNAHKKLLPYLPYKPEGNLTPRRESPPQIPTGAAAMLEITRNNIQDSIGMYDSIFGERSNERTGVAIQQRASRSDFTTFHFQDNYRRAVKKSTRQLIELIPKVYRSERIIRILGEEAGSEATVQINFKQIDPVTLEPVKDREGNDIIFNDITVGKYDVVESVKVMSTRRQESLQGMLQLASGSPQLSMVLAPEIAEMQDWPNAKKIKERIDAILPAMLGIQEQQQAQPTGGLNPGEGI